MKGRPNMVMDDWIKIDVSFKIMQKRCNCPMEEALQAVLARTRTIGT